MIPLNRRKERKGIHHTKVVPSGRVHLKRAGWDGKMEFTTIRFEAKAQSGGAIVVRKSFWVS